MPVSIPLALTFDSDGESQRDTVHLRRCIIGGWTARDHDAMEEHIAELEKLGVKRPPATPMFYPVSAARVTTADTVEVLGNQSSGEAEVVLLRLNGTLWVGVGSDHTDRKVEAYDIVVSKQMCDKPMAATLWRFDDIAPHWDQLILRSNAWIDGERQLYQQGELAAIMAPEELLTRFESVSAAPLGEATLLFTGTLAARGGVRPAERFEIELEDPVKKRTIHHAYTVQRLD